MKKIEYAWIEQILSFASEEEKQDWLDKRNGKLDRKHQSVYVINEWMKEDRLFIRIRLPYNQNPMLIGMGVD